MATILQAFRTAINDSNSPYGISDERALRYLDVAIDALSSFSENIVTETITITDQDITNGYVTTTYDIQEIIRFYPAKYNYFIRDNEIHFTNTDYWSTGTVEIEYNAYYKRFDGVDRDDSYLNYPKRAELGLILWGLGEYMDENSVVKKDGSIGVVRRKRERDMEVEYAINGGREGFGTVTTGDQARLKAKNMWARLPNYKSAIFSVSIF